MFMKPCRKTGKFMLLALTIVFFSFPLSAGSAELTLALADSTCDTMKQAGEIFTQKTDISLHYICQSSGLLFKGISEGSLPADYFLSASNKWIQAVVEAGLVNPEAVRTNWGNQLVVTSFPSKTGELEVHGLDDLLTPSVKTIIIGDPEIAPFGMYAKQALVNAEMWEKIQSKLKITPKITLSIRALKKLSLTTPGIVAFLYKTNVTDKMQVHFVVPQQLYPPVNYYSAPLAKAEQKKEMILFLDFIRGEEASAIFSSAGFVVNSFSQSLPKEADAAVKNR